MIQTTWIDSSETKNVISVGVTWTGAQPAIVTTPFSTSPGLTCSVCGREYEPEEGGWISVYRNSGGGESYNLCPECLKEVEGMINMLIQVLRGEKKR